MVFLFVMLALGYALRFIDGKRENKTQEIHARFSHPPPAKGCCWQVPSPTPNILSHINRSHISTNKMTQNHVQAFEFSIGFINLKVGPEVLFKLQLICKLLRSIPREEMANSYGRLTEFLPQTSASPDTAPNLYNFFQGGVGNLSSPGLLLMLDSLAVQSHVQMGWQQQLPFTCICQG